MKIKEELEKNKMVNKILRCVLKEMSEDGDVDSQVLIRTGDVMDLIHELSEATIEDRIKDKNKEKLIELLNVLIGYLKDFKIKYVEQ